MAADIFINYRGLDAEYVPALLARGLSHRFGAERVFLDADAIKPGEDYVERLLAGVRSAKVLLAVIGPRWFARDNAGQRLIDNPHDWIRRELVTAFECGVTVIPVFTEGAVPPRPDELPDDIAQLGRQHGLPLRLVRPGDDVDAIVREISRHLPAPPWRRVLLAVVTLLVVAAVVTTVVLLNQTDPDAGPAPTPQPTPPPPTTTTAATTATTTTTAAPPTTTTTTTTTSPPPVEEAQIWWEGKLALNGEQFQTGYDLDTSPPERWPAGDLGLVCSTGCTNQIQGNAFVRWTGAEVPTRQQCVDLLNHDLGQRTLSVKAGTRACLGTDELRVGYLDVVGLSGPQLTIDVTVWDRPSG